MPLVCPAAWTMTFEWNGQKHVLMLSFTVGEAEGSRPVVGLRITSPTTRRSTWSGWHGLWRYDDASFLIFVHRNGDERRVRKLHAEVERRVTREGVFLWGNTIVYVEVATKTPTQLQLVDDEQVDPGWVVM